MGKQVYLEIRDEMTLIPALAIELDHNPATQRLGYVGRNVLLIRLSDSTSQILPWNWASKRTMQNAHKWILANWDSIDRDGYVVDVSFILGETQTPKRAEMQGWV
jgi:hypothetical protein